MAGRVRVFSLTLWLMARACAYLRAALAVARATAAEHAWTIYATCVGVINVEDTNAYLLRKKLDNGQCWSHAPPPPTTHKLNRYADLSLPSLSPV